MYDTVIIGSGPAGLSASVYAKRSGLDFAVIEKEYMGTGQIAEASEVENYLGFPKTDGYTLGESFRNHALALNTEFIEGEAVKIVRENNSFRIELSDNTSIQTRTVIYSAGSAHRKLNIKGEKEFSGMGVSYCAVCDGAFYKDKTVCVVGGGDTALRDSLYLSGICKKVYVIHRRDIFRAEKALQEEARNTSNIEFFMDSVPIEISGGKNVESIKVLQKGIERTIETDGIFVAVGSIPETSMLKGIADLDENGFVIAGEDGITSAEGLFAAGDLRTKQLRQIATAVSDGANCVYSAEKYLHEKGWFCEN